MFVLNPAYILSGRTACFVLTFLSQFIIDHMYPQSLPGGHFSALQYHRWLFWTNTRDIVTNKAWTSKCSLWRRWKDWRSGRVVNLKAWDFRHFWFQVTQERWGRGRGSGKEREDREIRLEGVPSVVQTSKLSLLSAKETAHVQQLPNWLPSRSFLPLQCILYNRLS